MHTIVVLPILIPLLTAVLTLLLQNKPLVARTMSMLGAFALFVAGVVLLVATATNGVQVTQVGNWQAPFGITFVADLFSAIMVTLASLMGLLVTMYSLATIDRQREQFGYYSLFHAMLMGVCGAFLTGDIFNLYVWFEVLLIASFVLLALGSEKPQMEGAIKYVTLNLISSAFFLAAVGLLYAEVGTLNMADLARTIPTLGDASLITAIAALFLIAFGIKAAFFPLFFWLPASYHTPPPAVSAIFAGLLTKVGVYALIRVFTLVFVQDTAYTHTLILIIAGLTMIIGALGALAQTELRRILSFLIVSHIGFAVLGLGLYSSFGLAGAVFYVVEDMVVLTALFLVSGIISQIGGDERLERLGGLYASKPGLAVLFLIPALSLSGMPPFSGFFAKLALLQASLQQGQYLLVATMLVASLLTLLAITRIWSEVFWKPRPSAHTKSSNNPRPPMRRQPNAMLMWFPVVALAVVIVGLGIGIGPAFRLASEAGAQLFSPTSYVERVLGVQP